jgi:hypothetical protein
MAFDPLKDMPDIHGKVILVTGGEFSIFRLLLHGSSRLNQCVGNTGLGALLYDSSFITTLYAYIFAPVQHPYLLRKRSSRQSDLHPQTLASKSALWTSHPSTG